MFITLHNIPSSRSGLPAVRGSQPVFQSSTVSGSYDSGFCCFLCLFTLQDIDCLYWLCYSDGRPVQSLILICLSRHRCILILYIVGGKKRRFVPIPTTSFLLPQYLNASTQALVTLQNCRFSL